MKLESLRSNWTQMTNWRQLGELVYCSMCHEYGHRCVPATGANPPPIVTSNNTEPNGLIQHALKRLRASLADEPDEKTYKELDDAADLLILTAQAEMPCYATWITEDGVPDPNFPDCEEQIAAGTEHVRCPACLRRQVVKERARWPG